MAELADMMSKRMELMAGEWSNFIWEGTNVRPLAASTLSSKISKGSSYPDIPLIDTEEMVNSIKSGVEGSGNVLTGWIGSNSWKFPIHEYGLGPPPRPTLRPVVDAHDDLFDDLFDEYFQYFKEKNKK
jgi:hypothetical protein